MTDDWPGYVAPPAEDLQNHGTDGVYREMICVCGDENRGAADAMVNEVCRRLSEGSEELLPRTVTRENLLTAVVTSLHWDFAGASIEGIANDQWSGVAAEQTEYNPKTETFDVVFRTWIECDRVEDGIAYTWLVYATRKELGIWPLRSDDDGASPEG